MKVLVWPSAPKGIKATNTEARALLEWPLEELEILGLPIWLHFSGYFFLMLDWNLSNKDATKTQGFTAVHCIIMRSILMLWLIGRWLSPLYHWLMCRLLSVRCRLSLPVCLSSSRPPVSLCLTLWHILTKWPSVLSYCRICWRKNNIVTPQYHSDKDES